MHSYQNKRLLRSVALPNKTLISNVKHEYNLTETKIKCIQNGTMRENKSSSVIIRLYITVVTIFYYLYLERR